MAHRSAGSLNGSNELSNLNIAIPEHIVNAINDLLVLAGYDLSDDNLKYTPERFIRAVIGEFNNEADTTPKELFKEFDSEDYGGMIVVKNISFRALCAHHLFPWFGHAHVGYISDNKKVVGLSKIARIVTYFTNAITLQERATTEICDALWENLKLKGCIVVLSATHTCMLARGVRQEEAVTVTSDVRGIFKDNKAGSKEEFFKLIEGHMR